MGIHLLYIPLLPRSAIFNKSNFYFYWLQYTQYLRTDLITKGLLGNLLQPTFHGNETPGNLFCILFSYKVSRLEVSFCSKTTPEIYTSLLSIMLHPRSLKTWKEMDVWIEILKQKADRETPLLQTTFNSAPNSVSSVVSFK